MGINISGERHKNVKQPVDQSFDYVVTGWDDADRNCPLFTGKVGTRAHIGFPDPAAAKGSDEEVMKYFRSVRDDIREKFSDYCRREISKTLTPR